MSDFVDRYTPSEPYPRLIVPVALTTTFLCLFVLFALNAVNQYGPITDVHVSYLAIPAGMFLAFLASARVTQVSIRDVADWARAREDGPVETSPASDGSAGDGGDPMSTLKRRYATGELTEDEFERRVERLVETDRSDLSTGGAGVERAVE
ncbi:Short C-terminal domain-containing protein [Halomicrobium zhouii]|uniref:Short C-terminal domain-containing protein n=1 Tax=Halomicrobium zhouii TaxID=767519 RepID=A0A1I6LV67_9EURY|nr:SHOCT domain-containing protein [Halomicrobium zhouii]SFS07329.1 Short C-terminal domain-containing protein [Halomicrobium zhouii]